MSGNHPNKHLHRKCLHSKCQLMLLKRKHLNLCSSTFHTSDSSKCSRERLSATTNISNNKSKNYNDECNGKVIIAYTISTCYTDVQFMIFYIRFYNLYLQINITNLFFSGANWICAQKWWHLGPVWKLRVAMSLGPPGSLRGGASSVRV